jgi:hypothetical protein
MKDLVGFISYAGGLLPLYLLTAFNEGFVFQRASTSYREKRVPAFTLRIERHIGMSEKRMRAEYPCWSVAENFDCIRMDQVVCESRKSASLHSMHKKLPFY